MAKVFDGITDQFAAFIGAQPLFFVASAPLSEQGHVNLSPKGLDSFRILSPRRVAYLDLTGSGNETSAHLAENGRITFMFCGFSGKPIVLRLFGTGRVVLPRTAEWHDLRPLFPEFPGVRQIIVADIFRVQTSCGCAVPRMELVGQRDELIKWAEKKGEGGIAAYQIEKNSASIDGLPTPLAESAER